MKRRAGSGAALFLLLTLSALAAGAPGTPAVNTCVDCHLALDDPRLSPPARLSPEDVHGRNGFTCVFCHGGDASQEDQEKAHERKKGFLGRPSPRQIPDICGKCHGDAAVMKQFNPSLRVDQLSEYWTSVHGKKLREGDTKVAECASCHGAHGILPVHDSRSPVSGARIAQTCNQCHGDPARMAAYRLPTDIYTKYARSVHFQARQKGDASAPTCNSCHGNHGAAPPAVGSVVNVCGTCHAVFAEKFKLSPHWEAFREMNLPSCVTCHENHEIVRPSEAFLGEGSQGKCSSCHEPDSAGGKAAARMRADLLDLARETAEARSLVERAAEAGMEVSRIRFELVKADDALTRARTDVHLFRVAAVRQASSEGLAVARAAHTAAERALRERDFRREGLFVSLALILLSIGALLVAIRRNDARRNRRT